MATRYGPVKLRVPKGFPMLLQKFAKEVLREQPSDVAKFGEEYFKGLLDYRNATGEDPLIGEDDIGLLSKPTKVLRPISSEIRQNEIERENAAIRIQAGYRDYRVKKQSKQERDQKRREQVEAATKIQTRYRRYRQGKSLSTPARIEETTEPKEEVEQESKYGDDEREAAIRIQSQFRGYQVRKSFKSANVEVSPADAPEESPSDVEEKKKNDRETEAAVKIQVSYRAYRAKQHRKNTRESLREEGDAEDSKNDTEDIEQDQTVDETAGGPELTQQTDVEVEEDIQVAQDAVEEEEKPGSADDVVDQEMQDAALKIQASYRKHRARKQLNDNKQESVKDEPVEDEPGVGDGGSGDAGIAQKTDEERNENVDQSAPTDKPARDEELTAEKDDDGKDVAAIRIQARYRGYRTRKQLKSKKEDGSEPPVSTDAEQEEAQDVEAED